MTTILEALEKGTRYLGDRGIESPRLNMELLIAHLLGCQRMDLYLRFDEAIQESELSLLRKNLKKRSENTPIEYITNETVFCGHHFKTDERALIPRPETEELVELILQQDFPKPARILDLGCGSGVLGLSLAKALGEYCRELVLADLSLQALELARENTKLLSTEASLTQSDLFSNLTGTFDLIAANLPYIAEDDRDQLAPELNHEPQMALFSGTDGLDCLRLFTEKCSQFLNPEGLVALEVGYNQGEKVQNLLAHQGLTDCTTASDLNGIARFPLARKI